MKVLTVEVTWNPGYGMLLLSVIVPEGWEQVWNQPSSRDGRSSYDPLVPEGAVQPVLEGEGGEVLPVQDPGPPGAGPPPSERVRVQPSSTHNTADGTSSKRDKIN